MSKSNQSVHGFWIHTVKEGTLNYFLQFGLLAFLTYRSERVGKTNVGGTLLSEAKYINLSLHYLEQVRTSSV